MTKNYVLRTTVHELIKGANIGVTDALYRHPNFYRFWDASRILRPVDPAPDADDRRPDLQGMAVKIMLPDDLQAQVPDLPGEVYQVPREYYKTFDIIGINALEEFVVNDLPSYPAFFKASGMVGVAAQQAAQAGKTPQEIGQITSKIFLDEYIMKISPQLRPVAGALLQKIGTVNPSHLLAETYSSWVPYAYDAERAVKYSFVPCTDLSAATRTPDSKNYLGDNLRKDLSAMSGGGCFDLVAQFHEAGMPSVENAALPWGEKASRKYVKLANLSLPASFTDQEFCQALSFNPAHALPNQRGIGSTQRARRIIYAEISNRRNENVKAQQ